MTLGAAVQNIVLMGLPVAIYALVVRWRGRLAMSVIATRLGLSLGDGRSFAIGLAASVPSALVGIWASSWTKGFQGSTVAPFIDAAPTPSVLASALVYGLIGTGLPEELLFRGLIGGALFRRLSFGWANLLQACIFLLPHLLILLVAPKLWFLAIVVPLALGLVAGWLRFRSASILPGALVHAAGNVAGALALLSWR